MKSKRSVRHLIGIILLCIGVTVVAPRSQAQSVTRFRFTPTVVPETQVNPVKFEATITGNPASVAFSYNGVDRPMSDNGTNGDLVAGDGVWTIQFTAAEILNKNTPDRVFRPVIGQIKLASGAFNVVAEVWTSAIGSPTVHPIDANGQETDYIANYVATSNQLINFDQKVWAQRFYSTHGDKYDFLNFILIAGTVGNRFHFTTKNAVQGIGVSTFDSTSQYSSAGRLLGISTFPIPTFYDGAEQGFAHETGHQWINFLSGTSFAGGMPHWPLGDVANNVMGFSIGGPGGPGGVYGLTFSPNGSGGYVAGSANQLNLTAFNSMELYLMGLIPPTEVGTFFALNNQAQNVVPGQTLQSSEVTTVTVNDVVAARGARIPDSTVSQKNFRSATIVVSEQLLDAHAMALYDFFARRSEEKQQLPFASGLSTGTCNPWYLATGGRSVMTSSIADPTPSPTPTPPTNSVQFSANSYTTSEAAQTKTITVTRTGDTSGTTTVDFATGDISSTQRTDYTISGGTLTFAPGQTSKTFDVLITDDVNVEGNEVLLLTLSNPTGGAQLGSPNAAALNITDNEAVAPTTNPLDNAHTFVQQHYYDFLSRFPDQGGWDFWTSTITQCGSDPVCLRNQRIVVSNAFFYEQEYQQTGSYIFRLYRAAFGNMQPFPNGDPSNQTEAKKLPTYNVFAPDRARVVGGSSLAQGQAEFANAFVQRSVFIARYPLNLGGPAFVDAVLLTIKTDTGVDLNSERANLITLFNSGGRGAVMYRLADDNTGTNPINNRAFIDEEYNRAFVFTQYAGYLRRDSDIFGFLFWLGQVNSAPLRDTSKQHAMVCAFITSTEYQQRFSPIATHFNDECN
jgi:hypothetical protein